MNPGGFIDIHCHLLPNIDDGSKSWNETLKMAKLAVNDGISTIVATPHQLGSYIRTHGDAILDQTTKLQSYLESQGIPLHVLPGADVRIEADLTDKLASGEVLTLANRGKHVLLELPHELYFPLENLHQQLQTAGYTGILSHPERNQGILRDWKVIRTLIDQGYLMQITGSSLRGTFGRHSQKMAEWMVLEGLAHIVASDAHGSNGRRPLLRPAFERVTSLANIETANLLCHTNPAAVALGGTVQKPLKFNGMSRFTRLLGFRQAG